MLRLSAAGMAELQGAALSAPVVTPAAAASSPATAESRLYSTLLKTWCDGLIARQIVTMREPAFYGGLLCPACALIHGRCGDAVYPLLHMAHSTGDEKYLRASKLVHEWSEAQVSRSDGSWINDVTLTQWQGITVFHAIALAEALTHHGVVLDAATRNAWISRLAAAAKFLDGLISIKTGNVNYPATVTLAFVPCGQVLGEPHYLDRGRKLAQQVVDQFTSDGFLFGEGHPLDGVSPKGCRPVGSVQFIVPVIARQSERVEQASPQSVRISKPKGLVVVSVEADHHFEPIPDERTFNLVPGFEAVPLIAAIQPGNEGRMRIESVEHNLPRSESSL